MVFTPKFFITIIASLLPCHIVSMQVTLSSLNRHATARWADVGLPKTEILARALQEIIPCVQVEALTKMYW